MKLRTILLSLMVIVLVACNKTPSEHVFEGTMEDMDVKSVLTVDGDKIQKEHLTYELPYDVASISNQDEAEEAASIQERAYNSLIENTPEGAVEVKVTADEEKQAIIMNFDLDYSNSENIEALTEQGFLEDSEESEFVSFKKTKEQYEADGLKEKE